MSGKGTYVLRGKQGHQIVKSQTFDIDNGSGTTVDEVLLANLPYAIQLVRVQAVYTVATDTAGAASANFKLGVTAGGNTLVGATALEVSKAAGSATVATITLDTMAAAAALFVRHTGIAATEAGSYYVEVVYRVV